MIEQLPSLFERFELAPSAHAQRQLCRDGPRLGLVQLAIEICDQVRSLGRQQSLLLKSHRRSTPPSREPPPDLRAESAPPRSQTASRKPHAAQPTSTVGSSTRNGVLSPYLNPAQYRTVATLAGRNPVLRPRNSTPHPNPSITLCSDLAQL